MRFSSPTSQSRSEEYLRYSDTTPVSLSLLWLVYWKAALDRTDICSLVAFSSRTIDFEVTPNSEHSWKISYRCTRYVHRTMTPTPTLFFKTLIESCSVVLSSVVCRLSSYKVRFPCFSPAPTTYKRNPSSIFFRTVVRNLTDDRVSCPPRR